MTKSFFHYRCIALQLACLSLALLAMSGCTTSRYAADSIRPPDHLPPSGIVGSDTPDIQAETASDRPGSLVRLASVQDELPAVDGATSDRLNELLRESQQQEQAVEAAEQRSDATVNDGEDGEERSAADAEANAPGEIERIPKPTALPECNDTNQLTLDEVLTSVVDMYPLLEVALGELASADGKMLASWGAFDTQLEGYSISQPIGNYENYRNGFYVNRPLWNGGEAFGGYRIGRGIFEPWYQERPTNEGGEIKAGFKLPLLKGADIDERRAAVQMTQLERDRLDPDIRMRVIEMQLAASLVYWKWVAAGQVVRTQEQLVELALQRNQNLIKQVEAGDLPKITEIDNGRFIAKRQTKLIASERKVQEAAIKMSLFYRNDQGQPTVVADDRLPCDFPEASPVDPMAVESDIARALAQRPELLELVYQRQQVEVDLRYAQNQLLPKLDAFAETSQDVGAPTTSKRDKSDFQLQAGVFAEVPLQRRAASGKIEAARGKITQIEAKRRFVEDKIRSQVLDAVSALGNAFEQIEQAKENLRLTEQSLRLGRIRFDEGDIDIIQLNIYETSLAEAELLLIESEFAYFVASADYRAALGLQP